MRWTGTLVGGRGNDILIGDADPATRTVVQCGDGVDRARGHGGRHRGGLRDGLLGRGADAVTHATGARPDVRDERLCEVLRALPQVTAR